MAEVETAVERVGADRSSGASSATTSTGGTADGRDQTTSTGGTADGREQTTSTGGTADGREQTTSTGGTTEGTVHSGNSNNAHVFEDWSATLCKEEKEEEKLDHANMPFERFFSTDERAEMKISLGLFPGPNDERRDGKVPLPEKSTRADRLRVKVVKGFLVIVGAPKDCSWQGICKKVVPYPKKVEERYYTPKPEDTKYSSEEIQCLLTLDSIFLACFLMISLDIYPWMLKEVEEILHSQVRDMLQDLSLQILKPENQVPLESIWHVYKLLVTKLLRTPECDEKSIENTSSEVTDFIVGRISAKFVESNSIPSFPIPLFLGMKVVRQMKVRIMSDDISNGGPPNPSKGVKLACTIECRNLLHCQMEALWGSAFPAKYLINGAALNDPTSLKSIVENLSTPIIQIVEGDVDLEDARSSMQKIAENLWEFTLRRLMMRNSSPADVESPHQTQESENSRQAQENVRHAQKNSDLWKGTLRRPPMIMIQNSYPANVEDVREVQDKADLIFARKMHDIMSSESNGKSPDADGDPAPREQPEKPPKNPTEKPERPEEGYEGLRNIVERSRLELMKKYDVFEPKHQGLESGHGQLVKPLVDATKEAEASLEREHGQLVKPVVDAMKEAVASSQRRAENPEKDVAKRWIVRIGRAILSVVVFRVLDYLVTKIRTQSDSEADSEADLLETAPPDALTAALPTASELHKYGVSVQGQDPEEGIFPRFKRHRYRRWRGTLFLPKIKFIGKNTAKRWQSVLAYEDRWLHCTGIWDDIMWLYGKKSRRDRRGQIGHRDQSDRAQNNELDEDKTFNPKRRRKPFLSYLRLMDELINSEADVSVLSTGTSPVILSTNLGDRADVANIFNEATDKYANTSVDEADWVQLKTIVTNFHHDKNRRLWVQFFDENIGKPWVLVPLLLGALVSVGTAIQTYYSVLES